MMYRTLTLLLILIMAAPSLSQAQRRKKDKKQNEQTAPEEKDPMNSSTFSGLKFRTLGPALTSGRVSDLAVNPQNHSEYYVAVASGGVWKTTNAGTTYEPIFDDQNSYSIGCVTLDPNNPNVVWVGTGENNGQRSVAYGDGVYKSTDGGKSWKHMGLKESEHIGRIVVDPRNSDVVFVAAHGPLWSSGGERGLYKSTDGGETWKLVLEVDEHTGCNEVMIDPRNPDVMYANTWQRARKVWTFLGGGPGSGFWKSTDGGETWSKSEKGLPSGKLGRIGMAISPVNPDILYIIAEAEDGKGGFFRSTDRGASWKKMNDYTTSGNYYQELFCDPHNADRVYIMNTWAQVTDDGGKTIKPLGEKYKHVDNHAMWIDPNDPNHYLMGCDGGIYESWDRAESWQFKPNLPITQYYKVAVDNAEPFYNIYGGTQDNYSHGGPSRTINESGIVNSDWILTNGGDGFESAVDPENPDIVYAQAQYGWIVRFDKKSGERVRIQPQPEKGEEAYRWNWDAPLLVSPHKSTRIYFAANKVFRSDDRGNTWEVVSPDLTRQIDRNKLEVMGQVWGMDAVAKNRSTSIYGNIVALDESPLKEGLLYAGTDDGLVQVTTDGGENWSEYSSFPGVPETTYVNMLVASQHEENTVYAVFNNHKNGDFKPYILKSTDQGKNWSSISGDLPERGSVYAIAEDHVDPNLLFCGTEFGVFFTNDGGQKWIQLKGGLPTIAIRDIAIQRRENDLVLASFGRGFYVLDDYTPLRNVDDEILADEAHIFPVKDALMFVEADHYGDRTFQGASFYTAENPPVGAVFSTYLKESPKTLKEQRQEKEEELRENGEPIPYPTFEEMRAEDNEPQPFLLYTISTEDGEIVRRIEAPAKKGVNRVVWDFRYPETSPVSIKKGGGGWNPFGGGTRSFMATPGKYYVSLAQSVNGVITELTEKVPFEIKHLEHTTLPPEDRVAVAEFSAKVNELRRKVMGATRVHRDLMEKMEYLAEAVKVTPRAPIATLNRLNELTGQLRELNIQLNGDRSVSSRNFETPPSINDRVGYVMWGLFTHTGAPTQTQVRQYEDAVAEFEPVHQEIKSLIGEVEKLETELEGYGAPYTPGRLPGESRD